MATPFALSLNSYNQLPSAHSSIEAYIAAVNKIPLLTLEQEQDFAKRLAANNDLAAAQAMVLSHLRLVVSIARQYLGYGLPHADLIQEGNVGLMKAVKRFDPERGVRLVSFAMHWIKAEIHEYILKNWRMVKIATTKSQRKLFFNLRSMKGDAETLSEAEVKRIAAALDVKPEDVREMDKRFSNHEAALEPGADESDESFAPIAYIEDERSEPLTRIEQKAREAQSTTGIEAALGKLDDRSRRIIETRWLRDVQDQLTLHDLAAEFKVSAERIRQIETAALKKMRVVMA